MATKFVVLAAVLAALTAVASASTYNTVVTTTVDNEGNPMPLSCHWEIRKLQPQRCLEYFQGSHGFLRSTMANPRYPEEAEGCCNELKGVSSPCRCQAIKYMMQQIPGMEEAGSQMREKAESLPQMCGFSSPRQCRIRTLFV